MGLVYISILSRICGFHQKETRDKKKGYGGNSNITKLREILDYSFDSLYIDIGIHNCACSICKRVGTNLHSQATDGGSW